MVIIIICKEPFLSHTLPLRILLDLSGFRNNSESQGYGGDILTCLHAGYGYCTRHSQLSKAQQIYTVSFNIE